MSYLCGEDRSPSVHYGIFDYGYWIFHQHTKFVLFVLLAWVSRAGAPRAGVGVGSPSMVETPCLKIKNMFRFLGFLVSIAEVGIKMLRGVPLLENKKDFLVFCFLASQMFYVRRRYFGTY